MDLISLYKGILESIGLIVDEKGNVNGESIQGPEPVFITNKRLVLPTPDVLLNPDWEKTIAFHPLSENIARKDSVVFQRLQKLIALSLNLDVSLLMSTMIEICADKDRHKTLNHKQTAILHLFPNADETSLKNWGKIDDKLGKDHSHVRLVTLRDKKLNDMTYPRVTTVRFPIYEELKKLIEDKPKDYVVFGVKIRKKDAEGYLKLFEMLIKHPNEADEYYSFGTRSQVAPSFHALATAYHRVKSDLQTTARLLKLETPDLGWGDALADLSKYRGAIPPLAGNEGEITEGERKRNELALTPSKKQEKLQVLDNLTPVSKQPVQQLQPVAPAHSVPVAPPVQYAQPMMPTQPAPIVTPGHMPVKQLPGQQPQPHVVQAPTQPQVTHQPMAQQPVTQPQSTATSNGTIQAVGGGVLKTISGPAPRQMPQFNMGQQPMVNQYGQPMMMQPAPQVIQYPNDVPRYVDPMGKALPAVQSRVVAIGAPQQPQPMMYGQPMMGLQPGMRYMI